MSPARCRPFTILVFAGLPVSLALAQVATVAITT